MFLIVRTRKFPGRAWSFEEILAGRTQPWALAIALNYRVKGYHVKFDRTAKRPVWVTTREASTDVSRNKG